MCRCCDVPAGRSRYLYASTRVAKKQIIRTSTGDVGVCVCVYVCIIKKIADVVVLFSFLISTSSRPLLWIFRFLGRGSFEEKIDLCTVWCAHAKHDTLRVQSGAESVPPPLPICPLHTPFTVALKPPSRWFGWFTDYRHLHTS